MSNRESVNTRVATRNEKRAGNALQPEYLAMETGDVAERRRKRAMYSGTRVSGGPSPTTNLKARRWAPTHG